MNTPVRFVVDLNVTLEELTAILEAVHHPLSREPIPIGPLFVEWQCPAPNPRKMAKRLLGVALTVLCFIGWLSLKPHPKPADTSNKSVELIAPMVPVNVVGVVSDPQASSEGTPPTPNTLSAKPQPESKSSIENRPFPTPPAASQTLPEKDPVEIATPVTDSATKPLSAIPGSLSKAIPESVTPVAVPVPNHPLLPSPLLVTPEIPAPPPPPVSSFVGHEKEFEKVYLNHSAEFDRLKPSLTIAIDEEGWLAAAAQEGLRLAASPSLFACPSGMVLAFDVSRSDKGELVHCEEYSANVITQHPINLGELWNAVVGQAQIRLGNQQLQWWVLYRPSIWNAVRGVIWDHLGTTLKPNDAVTIFYLRAEDGRIDVLVRREDEDHLEE